MSSGTTVTSDPEQPILWLGMSGFTPHQRSALEAMLRRPDGLPRWRICAFGDADAWWINGSKARLMPDGHLKVAAGLPTEHALKLDLDDIDRPMAFALPVPGDDFASARTFDPVSAASVHGMLLQFETWLWQIRAEFVLGAQIVHRGAELRRGVYHVSHCGRLLAVLDFQRGKAALLPRVHAADLWAAQWDRRPVGAHDLPENFAGETPARLAWAYVRRTDRNLLPERYRSNVIYYRRVPGVPLRWLRDSQLMLLRELSAEAGTVDALRQRTGLSAAQVEHDLTCLYYGGAITTTRANAAAPRAGRQDSQPATSGPAMDSLLRGDAGEDRCDVTAPAMLEHKWQAEPGST